MKNILLLIFVLLAITLFIPPQANAQIPSFNQIGDCQTNNNCPTPEPNAVEQQKVNQSNTNTSKSTQTQTSQVTTTQTDNNKLIEILNKLIQLLKELLNNKCEDTTFSANYTQGEDDIEANHRKNKKRGLKKKLNCLKILQPKEPAGGTPNEPPQQPAEQPTQEPEPTEQQDQQPTVPQQPDPTTPPQPTTPPPPTARPQPTAAPSAVSPTTWVAPSTQTCAANYKLTNTTKKNFGDPACTFTKNNLSALLQQLDPTTATAWFNTVVPCESSYNPNAFAPPVGAQAQLDAGGAWGLFQMGSSKPPGSPPPAPGKNGVNDRGDVNWGVQAVNSTTTRKKNGWGYWACARSL